MLDHSGSAEASRGEGESPCPQCHHTSIGAHLGAVLCPSSQEKRGPSARLPPTSPPRQGGLREVSASLGVRMRLLWRIADDECSATTLRRKRDEWIASNARWPSMPMASRSDPWAPRPIVTTRHCCPGPWIAWRRSWARCLSRQGCIWTVATTRTLLASAWQNAI